jgi:hypothetical protein
MPTIDKAVVAYLETYGQPQSVAAIQEHGLNNADVPDLKEQLDALAASGKIYRLEDGVSERGETMIWYGPVAPSV